MKLSGWQWLAASSLMLAASASAETRPQYGGTLQVAVREALATLDPAGTLPTDSFARRNLTLLLFETLVTLGDAGNVRPGLATAWQTSPGNQRWQFQLRRGVKFHDGEVMDGILANNLLLTESYGFTVVPPDPYSNNQRLFLPRAALDSTLGPASYLRMMARMWERKR